MGNTTASVIVAVLNEEANIGHVMDTALSDKAIVEVIIADGGSSDGTVEKVQKRAQEDPRIRLLKNPNRGQAAGLNRAARAASGDVLVRLDGHTRYADDYVTASLTAWEPNVAVGGPMLAEGSTPWTRAIAGAMRDRLAIGPAKFRHADEVEAVDTVYLGAFERHQFIDLGGYRTFPSGTVEDTDFYSRWRSSGRTVLVDPSIRSWYRPRETWRGLAHQYFRYGQGKAELVWINGWFPSLRPLAPAILVTAIGVFVVVGSVWTWIPLATLGLAWLTTLGIVAVGAETHRLRAAVVAGTMHSAYGVGLWRGILSGRPTLRTIGFDEGARSDDNRSRTSEKLD